MLKNRWFEALIVFISIFLLIFLISKTSFVFRPVLLYVGAVAMPIIGAGVLYYVTKPIVHLFEKMKINRVIAILLVFLLLVLLGFLFVIYIFPIAQKQFYNLMEYVPRIIESAQGYITSFQSGQIMIPDQVQEAIDNFMNNIQNYTETVMTKLFGFIGYIITFVTSLVLIPFFLFFMLKDGDKLVPFITQIFDKKKAENIRALLSKIDDALTAFIQGQLIVSFCVGVLLFIGYVIIGLPYSLTLALFAMIMNVIPFLGPFIAVIPAIIVGAFQSPMTIVWVIVVTIVAQQIESNLISPNVMGRVLDLHPLTVITVILAAGSIAGFLGILFAVPFYAVIKTIVIHFYQTYQKTKSKKEDALI